MNLVTILSVISGSSFSQATNDVGLAFFIQGWVLYLMITPPNDNLMSASKGRRTVPWFKTFVLTALLGAMTLLATASFARASDADIPIPDLNKHGSFKIFGNEISRRQPVVLRLVRNRRHARHQPLLARPDSQAARPQVDARRRRHHFQDLRNVLDSAGKIPVDAVRSDRRV